MTSAQFRKYKIMVYMPNTKYGDRLFMAMDNNGNDWNEHIELFTSALSFPWWHGDAHVDLSIFRERKKWQNKCYVAKGGDPNHKLWEDFRGNREYTYGDLSSEYDLCIMFGVQTIWKCDVCYTVLNERPVLCPNFHGKHLECFIPYVTVQLEGTKIPLQCTRCSHHISDESWIDRVDEGVVKRYNRVLLVKNGAQCHTCPSASCDFELVLYSDSPESITCEQCKKQWCTRCNRFFQDENEECLVCYHGLKDVVDCIAQAIDEGAGTRCPTCFLRGQKGEEECTHITCVCGTKYCYCCGVSAECVDTSNEAGDHIDKLYGHNDDWTENPTQRCPMYLSDYSERYEDWPYTDDKIQKKISSSQSPRKINTN
eukprot:TRINITY_DN3228_c0_g1_i2.p1 TRINITY_DN3228_c0_g1~~TRINITY_DN3228_c0_g1_i2.p1  ORF type:complete len:369 (+),score=56.75 TRINITY_DN3228_c0_g1_i2:125-1231(+)